MALKGYHSYRGRQGAWRWLLTIMLVLVLIAACAFLLLQRYITYSDDGSFYLDLPLELSWDLPFLNGGQGDHQGDGDSTGEDPGEPEQDVNLIVDRPDEEERREEEEPPKTDTEPEPAPPVVAFYTPRRIIELAELPQDETALFETLTDARADGFAFTAKRNGGQVSYASSVAMTKAVEENAVSRELIGRLCAQEDVYTVARINCFRDTIYAFANMEAAGICQKNGYIWYANATQHWLDPEKEAARQYVIDLAVECAQMGFDELLLEEMYYPGTGNLYKIDYSKNTMSKTDALVLFLTELNAALEPYGVNVSLLLEEAVVRGLAENTEDTGLVAQQILPLVDAVYVATADEETVREEMKVLLDGKDVPALVPVVSGASDADSWYMIG